MEGPWELVGPPHPHPGCLQPGSTDPRAQAAAQLNTHDPPPSRLLLLGAAAPKPVCDPSSGSAGEAWGVRGKGPVRSPTWALRCGQGHSHGCPALAEPAEGSEQPSGRLPMGDYFSGGPSPQVAVWASVRHGKRAADSSAQRVAGRGAGHTRAHVQMRLAWVISALRRPSLAPSQPGGPTSVLSLSLGWDAQETLSTRPTAALLQANQTRCFPSWKTAPRSPGERAGTHGHGHHASAH